MYRWAWLSWNPSTCRFVCLSVTVDSSTLPKCLPWENLICDPATTFRMQEWWEIHFDWHESCLNVIFMKAYLAEGGSRITSLDVSFCDKIDDQALGYVAQGLSSLKQLSMSACHVSDEGLIRLAHSLLDLQTLNIGQCSRITDRSIQAVADHLRNLRCIGNLILFFLLIMNFLNKFIYCDFSKRSLRMYEDHYVWLGKDHEASSA